MCALRLPSDQPLIDIEGRPYFARCQPQRLTARRKRFKSSAVGSRRIVGISGLLDHEPQAARESELDAFFRLHSGKIESAPGRIRTYNLRI